MYEVFPYKPHLVLQVFLKVICLFFFSFSCALRSLSSLLGDFFKEFRGGYGEGSDGTMKENNKGKRGKL